MNRRFGSLLIVCVTLSVLGVSDAAAAAVTLGVMGDSLSDEYSEQSYGSYSQSWVQQLVTYDGVNAGPTAAAAGQPGGTWGEPRRTGYQFNWARYGDDSNALLSKGQHTGLAGQVAANNIQYAVLAIGANDFFPLGTAYQAIYNGTWSAAQIQTYETQVVNNIKTAINTVLPTGVKLELVNVPDYNVTPAAQYYFPNAVNRAKVSAVITQVNSQLQSLASTDHLVYVDLQGLAYSIFGATTPNTTLSIGGVPIHLTQYDTATGALPQSGFVDDAIHPNTTIQGVLANLFVQGLNQGYHANIPLFSEAQILAHRGLAYGGSDTLTAQIGPYSNYVINNVPEPSSATLAIVALCGLFAFAISRRRRRSGRGNSVAR